MLTIILDAQPNAEPASGGAFVIIVLAFLALPIGILIFEIFRPSGH